MKGVATSIPFVRKREEALAVLNRILAGAGVAVTVRDELGHGVKLHASYKDRSFAVILYYSDRTGQSSKVVLERETEEIRRAVLSALTGSPDSTDSPSANPLLAGIRGECHIGIDESGKGDYFGPLVIAGVCADPDDGPKLVELGVRDSKLLQDKQVNAIAEKMRSLLGGSKYEVVCIGPEKYNELYGNVKNLNKLLAWGHARVLENLLGRNACGLAVCDQFGDESHIERALMEKGKAIKLIQTPKAEQDIAVAAASILARDTFLRKLAELSEKYGMSIPKGASAKVEEVARELVKNKGDAELAKVAKLHFRTTQRVAPQSPA
jgi:ribonuclease HIII